MNRQDASSLLLIIAMIIMAATYFAIAAGRIGHNMGRFEVHEELRGHTGRPCMVGEKLCTYVDDVCAVRYGKVGPASMWMCLPKSATYSAVQ